MTDLPSPLTPPDCDLRGYDFMPLHGARLFGSRFYMKSLRNPRAGLAAIKLWWAAWQQCPAGSLPNDDDDLAILADFGTDTKGWAKCRDLALHGFVLCSDGRLYHPILCDEATDAYARRVSERERKAKQREAKKAKREGQDGGVPGDVPSVSHGTAQGQDDGQVTGRDADFRSDRTGQDRTDITLPSVVPPDGADRDADLPAEAPPHPHDRRAGRRSEGPIAPVDARKLLFGTGLVLLRRMTGKPEGGARTLIGKWLKTARDDASIVARAIGDASSMDLSDPVAWIEKAVRQRCGSQQTQLDRRWGMEGYDLDANADRLGEEMQF